MNLIDRYVNEIGKRLPRKSRADIETEIRSTLEDMLEERAAKAGRPADDEMVKELLQEYGAPDKVAATYLPEQYLIGPRLFPIFMLVAKIVFTVVTILAIVGVGIKLGTSGLVGQEAVKMLLSYIAQYVGGIISAFGNLVLVFALIERFMPKADLDEVETGKDWTPAMLEQEPDPDEVRMWEPVLAIVFTTLGLLVFNFYPQVLGIVVMSKDAAAFIPVLSEAFFRMLPWINVTWILGIGLNAWLLRQGRWTPPARWVEIALNAAGVIIAYFLLQGPSILALTPEAFIKLGLEASAANTLTGIMHVIVSISLGIAIIVGGIEVIVGVYKLLFKARPKPLVIK